MIHNGRCISCGAKLYNKPIFSCGNMPAGVQNLPTREELPHDKAIELSLYQCSMCGLIQLDCEPVDYWKDSTRAGERSAALVDLNKKHFRHFIDSCNLNKKRVIEIGAGKGGFMKTLAEIPEYDLEICGLENNSEFVSLANAGEYGGVIHNGFIDKADYKIEDAPYDAFYSFSYLARLINPNEMLQGIGNNLKPGGYGFLRAICAEYISNEDGFFEVTHDLYAYYGEDSIKILLQQNGFVILETWVELPYICVIVKKRTPYDIRGRWNNIEGKINEVRDFVAKSTSNGRKLAVWCASHYAFTVLSVCGVGENISYIIDNAPFKQGRYSPATHIPIVSPGYFGEHRVDTVLILSDFYVDEIVDTIRTIHSDVGIYSMNKDGIYSLNEGET